jgi:hypothetical protein
MRHCHWLHAERGWPVDVAARVVNVTVPVTTAATAANIF